MMFDELTRIFEWIDFGKLNGIEQDIRDILDQAGEYMDESRKTAIISAHSIIGENTTMENVVVDRDAQIIHSTLIKGTLENPVCIERGDIV